ncbi:hypothetical protein [Mycolicibacterium celeriflavum]|uniref:Uncharacterized protein n=1 Tax=Mycolicibacterium celeriflavum TaxID=1249101 RepID=A0A1X0C115_MYCCF|nr:hypothetical protein [Mycolicibacterium celeriflavum]MCV7237709.1 hypothetical protein [Mycolicibacterium celeriflavum]ORA49977.1 hypothetical protein BST21_05460 [Mycolicibacterium celeriflavum]BBY42185.1 hypothetical protein MCEL_04800 [Mycolicibacterium celeriflavum]
MTTNTPPEAFIVGDNGLPLGHINIDQLQADATLLMYEMAAAAGNDTATDQVSIKWASTHDPDYFGYLCAAALSLMTRHVLAPTLDVTAQLGTDLRPGLHQASDDAHRDLGGDI